MGNEKSNSESLTSSASARLAIYAANLPDRTLAASVESTRKHGIFVVVHGTRLVNISFLQLTHTMKKQEAAQAYAAKKLCQVIESLAVQEGDARSRIMHAQTLIMSIKDSDFPPHLLDDWRWVKAQMSRLDPLIENGSGKMFRISDKAATKDMRNTTAKKVAQTIWGIYWKISQNQIDR